MFGEESDAVTIYRFTGPVLVRTQNGFAPSLDSDDPEDAVTLATRKRP